MTLQEKLTPLNLNTQKQQFLKNQHYNPQFIYPQPLEPATLTKYGLPQKKFLLIAKNYLSKHPLEKKLAAKTNAPALSKEEIEAAIFSLCERINLAPPEIVYSDKLITRLAVVKNRLIINSRPTSKLTAENLPVLLAHELQTHYLRYINQTKQSFKAEKRVDYLRTEEGLAILTGSFYGQDLDFRAICALYCGVELAQRASFSEVFTWFSQQFSLSFNKAWAKTMRLKRGLTDTSMPGGFSKDLIYLEGLIEVIDYLLNPDNQWQYLYLGKIACSTATNYQHIAKWENLSYPDFLPHRLADFLSWAQACKLELVPPQF